MEELSFSYENNLIFQNINLSFKKGNVYYICGQSGTGKSTLLQLIAGQLMDYTGEIKYNDTSIKFMSPQNITEIVTFVTQDTILFNDTIINNIVLDKDIDYERVRNICYTCSILDDIEQLPDKFETELSEKGANFSGGQKSRICLARALYQDKPVLIIDEVTSGLDGITERNIRERLCRIAENKIVIIVTHSENFIIKKALIYTVDDHSIIQGEPVCLK